MEVMEFQLSYLKSQQMMLLKCYTQYLSKFRKLSSATGLEKVSFYSDPQKGQCQIMSKLLQNCNHFSQQGNVKNPPSQTSAVHEFSDVQSGFRKGRRTRYQIANIHWIIEKAREFQKNIYFCFIDYVTVSDFWITTICGNFLKRWEYQTT